MEMDFLRRSARFSRLKNLETMLIEEKMNIENSVLDYKRHKQLNWYGHVQRMNQERLPRRILKWCPPGRRRKGRSPNPWMQEVITGIKGRGIGDLEWVDREVWRKKVNFP